jgi:hypothetical protein
MKIATETTTAENCVREDSTIDHRGSELQSLRQELKTEFQSWVLSNPLREDLSSKELVEQWCDGIDPWSISVDIVFWGNADVYVEGKLVTDPDELRGLDGLLCHEAHFTDLLGKEGIEARLAGVLVSGGRRHFHYLEGSEWLEVSTEYQAIRPLDEEEVTALKNFTLDQWADEIEEGYWARSHRLFDLVLDCHWFPPGEAEELGYPSVEVIPNLPSICSDCRKQLCGG